MMMKMVMTTTMMVIQTKTILRKRSLEEMRRYFFEKVKLWCKMSDFGNFQEPLNSGDDVSDEDTAEQFDTENVVVCQYDKVGSVLVFQGNQLD